MPNLILIADNAKPDKPKKLRRLPKVAPRCPACDSPVWFYVNLSPADRSGSKPMRKSIAFAVTAITDHSNRSR